MQIQKLKKREIKKLISNDRLLEFNREIQPRHVEKMRVSVMSCGILRLPVLGDVSAFDKRGLVIVDGQHLCSAVASSTLTDVDVIIKKYKSKKQLINDISKLNNIQKSWNDEDYLEAWFKYGQDNYSHYDNYNYLNYLYQNKYDGLPCGFLVDLYATSKGKFREGELEFRNREFSDKLADICYDLSTEFKKSSFALHGLRLWAFNRLSEKKNVDFKKLESRLKRALRNGEDKNTQVREDFREFVQEIYNRL